MPITRHDSNQVYSKVAEANGMVFTAGIALFERGLDPDKRSQLGAHYTDRDKIMMIVGPVMRGAATANDR